MEVNYPTCPDTAKRKVKHNILTRFGLLNKNLWLTLVKKMPKLLPSKNLWLTLVKKNANTFTHKKPCIVFPIYYLPNTLLQNNYNYWLWGCFSLVPITLLHLWIDLNVIKTRSNALFSKNPHLRITFVLPVFSLPD